MRKKDDTNRIKRTDISELSDEQLENVVGGQTPEAFEIWRVKHVNEHSANLKEGSSVEEIVISFSSCSGNY